MKSVRLLAISAALGSIVGLAQAQNIILQDNGSVASLNFGGTQYGVEGLNSWQINPNGPNNVQQEVFAVNIPGIGTTTLNDLANPVVVQPLANYVDATYNVAGVVFDTRYLLSGGPPNSSDLAEVVTIHNSLQNAVQFKFFEYDYFSPGGQTGGTGTLLNSSTIQHTNGPWSVTVGATPIPDAWMIDTTGNVVNALVAGQLTDANSPFNNPNDLAFAFQWDVNINAGQTWQMSKNKIVNAVPEPASLLVLASALAMMASRRRNKKA